MNSIKLTPSQKVVLAGLIIHSEDNRIQITYDQLSKITGISTSTLPKVINYLCSQDLLSKKHMFVTNEKFMNNRKQANLYTVKISLNELFNKGL